MLDKSSSVYVVTKLSSIPWIQAIMAEPHRRVSPVSISLYIVLPPINLLFICLSLLLSERIDPTQSLLLSQYFISSRRKPINSLYPAPRKIIK